MLLAQMLEPFLSDILLLYAVLLLLICYYEKVAARITAEKGLFWQLSGHRMA
ncbi:hypothetical protein [Chlorobaculum sp. 24CR]|uniref:hypothetical protein n=1 Tax=Chlorobaculum sp. 24CR TaxID=2508878 RepID=UPI001FD6869C|nr:hypothetical protein [Chlorobaculum sp. 24CR]